MIYVWVCQKIWRKIPFVSLSYYFPLDISVLGYSACVDWPTILCMCLVCAPSTRQTSLSKEPAAFKPLQTGPFNSQHEQKLHKCIVVQFTLIQHCNYSFEWIYLDWAGGSTALVMTYQWLQMVEYIDFVTSGSTMKLLQYAKDRFRGAMAPMGLNGWHWSQKNL